MRWVRDYLGLLVGAVITAVALDAFLVPNRVAAGGVSGLATVLHHLWGLPVGLTMLALNVPLFVGSLFVLGPSFGARTVVGAVAVSVAVDAMAPFLGPLTTDPLLAAGYGGALAGVGIGITFRYGGSTGGTDMAARILERLLRVSAGRMLLAVDGAVIAAAGLAFGAELALYALLAVFLTSKAIDWLQEGRPYARAAFIISRASEQIATGVLTRLDRGATAFRARGLYTGIEREVLFVIVHRQQLQALKELVHSVDPAAFVVITEVSEVIGEGFRLPTG
ncbi:MAG TPA: YitT family protein [Limnochordia bacterium]